MLTSRIGIDSYSFHRLLGELRHGEVDPGERLADGGRAVIAEAEELGVDAVSLQTSFLGTDRDELEAIANAAGTLELVFAWGAPNGIELGANAAAAESLCEWIELAAHAGCRTMRIVAGGPSLRARADDWPRAVPALRRVAAHTGSHGLTLALENHGDLTAVQIAGLLHEVGDDALRVCFDSANAARVGDDVIAAAELLASAVVMVHLKDVEPLENVVDPTAGPCSVPYGEGIIPLRELLAVLCRDGLAPVIFVELGQLRPGSDERALLASCVDWLRS
jgi:3-oxoisoapionate decarboxylase